MKFILAAAILCDPVTVINRTPYPINNFDTETLARATKRCKELYSKSPCIKYFIKTGAKDYQVVCGKEKIK